MSMEWVRLLSDKKLGNVRAMVQEDEEGRNGFQRDFDRIVFSSAFRRLQNKTQVAPFPGSDHVHNRLVHSLETSSVGRSLGKLVGQEIVSRHGLDKKKIDADDFAYVVAAACLAHDIGNPPLGHSGEDAISEFFKGDFGSKVIADLSPEEQADFTRFEGNALGFRILTHSHPSETSLTGGMGLTYATLATCVKYPKESLPEPTKESPVGEKKYGFLQADKQVFTEVAEEVGLLPRHKGEWRCWSRHPLAFLTEAADDICNCIVDLEDGFREGLVQFEDAQELLKSVVGDALNQNNYDAIIENSRKIKSLRAKAISRLVIQVKDRFLEQEDDLLQGHCKDSLVEHIAAGEALKRIKVADEQLVYTAQSTLDTEAAGFGVMAGLLSTFLRVLITEPNLKSSKKFLHLLPKEHLAEANQEHSGTYEKVLCATQVVAGMTDRFAVDTYRLLTGMSLPGY